MMKKFTPVKPYVEPRPSPEPPDVMVEELMQMIRGQFYGDAGARTWPRDQQVIRRDVVLWPAAWLKDKGLTMTPVRYRALLIEKLNDVKRNCAQASFKYLPAYLAKCVQDHFRFHEDEINAEAKAITGSVHSVLSKLKVAPAADPIWAMAGVHAILTARKRAKKQAPPAPQQGELL
jgi:hypothetical protein